MNIWNQIGSISLSLVNAQHIGMFGNGMFIHDNHTTVLIIHNKTFLIPCVSTFALLSTFFLVDKWHIMNHICWFKRVYNSKRIINLKENPHSCYFLMKRKPKLLVYLQLEKLLMMMMCFNLQNLFPKFSFSNQFIKWFKSNPTIIIPHLPFNNIYIIGINSWLKKIWNSSFIFTILIAH